MNCLFSPCRNHVVCRARAGLFSPPPYVLVSVLLSLRQSRHEGAPEPRSSQKPGVTNALAEKQLLGDAASPRHDDVLYPAWKCGMCVSHRITLNTTCHPLRGLLILAGGDGGRRGGGTLMPWDRTPFAPSLGSISRSCLSAGPATPL